MTLSQDTVCCGALMHVEYVFLGKAGGCSLMTSGTLPAHHLGEGHMEGRLRVGAVHAVKIILPDILALADAQIGHRIQFRRALAVLFNELNLVRIQRTHHAGVVDQ